MLETAFNGDRVEPAAHGIGAPEHLDPIDPGQVLLEDGGNRKDALAGLAKLPEQLRILEFPDDLRADLQRVEPLVEPASDGGIRGRQQKGGAVQRFWKAPAIRPRKF